ncbi:MAG TPA: hypothetical protein G4O06_02825 [Dehalococcoidia bacterium]|nr:hypothetical protein [Dehalococcoidia bacterium]
MTLLLILAILATVGILFLVFWEFISSQPLQDWVTKPYPGWVTKAFKEFEIQIEEDNKFNELARIIRYFPDAKITQEGNRTVIYLDSGTPLKDLSLGILAQMLLATEGRNESEVLLKNEVYVVLQD